MKTTLGKIRLALREAAPTDPKQAAFARGLPHYEKLSEHDGLKVGDWVMVAPAERFRGSGRGKPHAGEIKEFTVVHNKDQEPYVTISVGFGGHSSQRRFDVWKAEDFVGMADEEDIQNAKDAWQRENEWMSKNIDTSREGT